MSEIILSLALPEIPAMDSNNIIHIDDTTSTIEVIIPHWSDYTLKDKVTLYFGKVICPSFTVSSFSDVVKFDVPASGLMSDYYDVYYDIFEPASGNKNTSPHMTVYIENSGAIMPEPVVRLQPIPSVFFEGKKIGRDCISDLINFSMIDSPSPISVEIHFNQQAGKVTTGDKVDIRMFVSAYEQFTGAPKRQAIPIPSPKLTDDDIAQGYYAFNLEKSRLSGFDATPDNIKGTVWMTAEFKNTAGSSYTCVWWCDIDTIPPGSN